MLSSDTIESPLESRHGGGSGEKRSCCLEVTGVEEGRLQVGTETTTDSRVQHSFKV